MAQQEALEGIVKVQMSLVDRCRETLTSVWQEITVGGPRLGVVSDPLSDLRLPARADLGILFTRSYSHLAPTAEPIMTLRFLPEMPTEVRVRDPKCHAVIYLTEEQAQALKSALIEQYSSYGQVREIPSLLKDLL